MGRFPSFLGTVQRSDSLPPLPPRSLPCLAVPSPCRSFSPVLGATGRVGGHGVGLGDPGAVGIVDGGGRVSQVPGEPLRTCPGLRSRRTPRRQAEHGDEGAAFHQRESVGVRNGSDFGTRSRGPCARCLRFTLGVTPASARLASGCSASSAGRVGWTRIGLHHEVSPVVLLIQVDPVAPRSRSRQRYERSSTLFARPTSMATMRSSSCLPVVCVSAGASFSRRQMSRIAAHSVAEPQADR